MLLWWEKIQKINAVFILKIFNKEKKKRKKNRKKIIKIKTSTKLISGIQDIVVATIKRCARDDDDDKSFKIIIKKKTKYTREKNNWKRNSVLFSLHFYLVFYLNLKISIRAIVFIKRVTHLNIQSESIELGNQKSDVMYMHPNALHIV